VDADRPDVEAVAEEDGFAVLGPADGIVGRVLDVGVVVLVDEIRRHVLGDGVGFARGEFVGEEGAVFIKEEVRPVGRRGE